jgi:hypothetical protein
MYQQAYQLKETDESKFYALLEILDIKPHILTQTTREDYEPSNHYLDYFCPFCQISKGDNPCINCHSLFCHK